METSLKGVMPEWYKLEAQKDEPDAVAFYLVPLDGFGKNELKMLNLAANEADPVMAVILRTGIINRAFKLGVKDWKNIPDTPFSAKAMSRLESDWIMEVGARVLEISELGVKEVKN